MKFFAKIFTKTKISRKRNFAKFHENEPISASILLFSKMKKEFCANSGTVLVHLRRYSEREIEAVKIGVFLRKPGHSALSSTLLKKTRSLRRQFPLWIPATGVRSWFIVGFLRKFSFRIFTKLSVIFSDHFCEINVCFSKTIQQFFNWFI